MSNKRNILIVLSGPSGVGKGTVAKMLVKRNPCIKLSVSCTTRSPRDGEKDGIDYFFTDRNVFKEKINQGGFLEYSEHFENFYGTPKDFVLNKLKTDDVLLEIDVNGGLNVKKNYPQAVLIMLLPPSVEELHRRLTLRHTESEEKINLRMQRINYELGKKDFYDYLVVNDDLELTVSKIEDIINSEKSRIL